MLAMLQLLERYNYIPEMPVIPSRMREGSVETHAPAQARTGQRHPRKRSRAGPCLPRQRRFARDGFALLPRGRWRIPVG